MTSDPTHVFVYRAPCGCVRGIVVDDSEAAPQWTAERQAEFAGRGYVESRVPMEKARRGPATCPHKTPGQPAVGQQGLFEGGVS